MDDRGDFFAEPPQRDTWTSYALEKITQLLVHEELYLEDRNRTFSAMWFGGIIFMGSAWWNASRAPVTGIDWGNLLFFAAAFCVFISGVALRINNGFELRRIRRLLKLAEIGTFPG